MAITGGCLCGAVRYEVNGKAKWQGKCYCRDCQRESGGGHNTILGVSAADFTLTQGELSHGTVKGGSGNDVIRSFCPRCGTTVYGHPKLMGNNYMVRVGTLDDPSAVVPAMAIFTSHAQPWDLPPEGLICFPEAPPPPTA